MAQFLGILLKILSVLGIILGALVALCILILLIVLFCPIKYKIKARYNGKFEYSIDAHYIGRLVTYYLGSDKSKDSGLKYPFSGSKKEDEDISDDDFDYLTDSAFDDDYSSVEGLSQNDSFKEVAETDSSVETDSITETDTVETSDNKKIIKKEKITKNKKAKKIKVKRNKTRNKKKDSDRKTFTDYINIIQSEEFDKAFEKAKKELVKLLKAILPRKFIIKGEYAFEDPQLTGKIMGYVSFAAAFFPKNIKVYGHFDDNVINLDSLFVGRIYLNTILWIVIRVYFSKDIRNFINLFKDGVKDGEQ